MDWCILATIIMIVLIVGLVIESVVVNICNFLLRREKIRNQTAGEHSNRMPPKGGSGTAPPRDQS